MYERFRKTGAIFPAAVIGVVSALMALFYVWSIALGPVPGKPKLKK